MILRFSLFKPVFCSGFLLCLLSLLLVTCAPIPKEGESRQQAEVTLTLQHRADRLARAGTDSRLTEFIVVVPGGTPFLEQGPANPLASGLLNLDSKQITLQIDLDTPLRLFIYRYAENLSLTELQSRLETQSLDSGAIDFGKTTDFEILSDSTTDTLDLTVLLQREAVFLDAAVEGLQVQTIDGTQSTDADGMFVYFPEENVQFSLGELSLGSFTNPVLLTPYSIFGVTEGDSANNVLNLVRLLMTLDGDGNPENGIQLSAAGVSQLGTLNLADFDTSPESFDGRVSSLALVGVQQARQHLLQLLQQKNNPLTVSSFLPLDNGSLATLDTSIFVEFSEPLRQSSIKQDSALTLQNGSTLVAGSLSVQNNQLSFKPSNPLSPNTSYTVTLDTNLSDQDGKPLSGTRGWTFQTGELASAPGLEVLNTSPENQATEVPLNSTLVIYFPEAVLAQSEELWILEGRGTEIACKSRVTENAVYCQPQQDLSANTTYTLTLLPNLVSESGNQLSEAFVLSFTTGTSLFSAETFLRHRGGFTDNYTNSPSITLLLSSANENSLRYQVTDQSVAPSSTGSGWQTPLGYPVEVPFRLSESSSGSSTTLTAWFDDGEELVEQVRLSLVYDSVSPSGQLEFAQSSTRDAEVGITLSASDQLSPIAWYLLKLDNLTPALDAEDWIPLENGSLEAAIGLTREIDNGQERTLPLYGWVLDAAGNLSEVFSDQVLIDLSTPEASLALELEPYLNTESLRLELKVEDNSGGELFYLLSKDQQAPEVFDLEWQLYEGDPISLDLAGEDEGVFSRYLWIKDAADNLAQRVELHTVIDRTPPKITEFSIEKDPDNISNVLLSWVASDNITALKSFYISESGTPPGEEQWLDYTQYAGSFQYFFGENVSGSKSLNLFVRDEANNSSSQTGIISLSPTLTLSVSSTSINENTGSATITLTLSSAAASDTEVELLFSGTAGTNDYMTSSTLTIPTGKTTETATIQAIDNSYNGSNKTIIIEIGAITGGDGAWMEEVQTTTITILDDDPAPSVSLSTDNLTLAEFGGTSTLTATLSTTASENTIISLGISTASSSDSNDFTIGSTSLTIPAGSLTATTTLTTINDTLSEGDESILLEINAISGGNGAVENGPQQLSFTIIDNNHFIEGNGTAAFPYEIDNVAGLQAISDDLSAHYKLTSDIDLSGINWTPIGNNTNPFTGSLINNFDPNSSGPPPVIRNLSINATTPYQGLFGYTQNAIFKYVLIDNVSIISTSYTVGALTGYAVNTNFEHVAASSVKVNGTSSIGGMIGILKDSTMRWGHVSVDNLSGNSHLGGFSGWVDNSTLSNLSASCGDPNCEIFGNVTTLGRIGGLVGYLENSMLDNSSAAVPVVAASNEVGGLVGAMEESKINQSSSHRIVQGVSKIGGLVGSVLGGYKESSILNSYHLSDNVSGNSSIGGLVGSIGNNFTSTTIAVRPTNLVENSYAASSVVNGTTQNIGGLVGYKAGTNSNVFVINSYYDSTISGQVDNSGKGTPATTADLQGAQDNTTAIFSGWDFVNVWDPCGINEYPRLRWEPNPCGGTSPTILVTLSPDNLTFNENSGSASITATLSSPVSDNTTITLATSGTAIKGSNDDYTISDNLTIAAGNTVGTINLIINDDNLTEGNETILIEINSVSGGNGATENGTQQLSFTIIDNDNVTAQGDGSLTNPFLVSSASQLQAIGDNATSLSAHYKLTSDIDLSGIRNWTPLGTFTNKFNGSINGDNYTISNLIIDNQTDNFTGFFRFVSGTIHDLKFKDTYIRGYERVGLLSGKQTSGSISQIEIDNLTVVGLHSKSGGIIGESFGSISKISIKNLNLSGQQDSVGGLVGRMAAGSIELSSVMGNVAGNNKVGGLVGNLDNGSITNSYAWTDITDSSGILGGLTGRYSGAGPIKNSYAIGSISGGTNIGGGGWRQCFWWQCHQYLL